MEQKNIGKKLFISVFFLILVQAVAGGKTVLASDGSGTNTVNPTSATVSSTGNTFTFTFTAAETMSSGEIKLSTPSGWSTIQSVSGTAGYTTATSTGLIADVINNADSITNWFGGKDCGSVTESILIFHEGTGSVECAAIVQGANNGMQFYSPSSALDWSSYTRVGFWIYSTAAVASGDFAFAISSKSNFISPQLANINTAIPANTWTYIILDVSGLTRSSILSYGLEQVTSDVTINLANVFLDDILAGPGRPTFSGGAIDVRLLSLANGQTVTFIYGSGGGTSGVTAPSVAGTSVATTTDRVSDAGTLTNISSQPTLAATSASNPVPSTTSISPTSTTAGSSQFTLTVNGSNFISSSTVNWNGSARTTTYVSATQLTATIPASDVSATGTVAVTVVNPSPGGGTSNSQTFTIVNPAPTITSISPTSTTAGASQFTLTVNGSNFVSGATVDWNGSARTTTFISSSQLTATIPASDVSSSGTATITVVNPSPGGGTSNSETFVINSVSGNPVPTITSISPTSTDAGSSSFTLTVNGTNFISSSSVNWNGSSRTTVYVSATQLTTTILASDVAATGTVAVTVVSPSPGGGTSNSETFTINSVTSPPSPSPSSSPTTSGVTNFSGSSLSNATFSGWAYPKSSIDVFEKSTVSGQYESVPFVQTDISSDGKFTITLQNFLQAGYFFALRAADIDGRTTSIIPFSQFIPGGTNMMVNKIIFPPTLDIQPQAVAQGEKAYVIGYAAPGSKVEIKVDDVPVGNAIADENGYYKFSLAADSLKTGIHSLKTRQTTVDGDVSYFSLVKIFSVSPFSHPLADFNGDGVIDIRDWSAFLYRWNAKDWDIKKLADLNGDGKVDISDFSIFLKEFNNQSK